MQDYRRDFLEFAMERGALLFGEFTLKSGRISPYFFNSGRFDDGAGTAALGRFYAAAIIHSGIAFDMLYGPAYKGIPLAVATAVALSESHGRNVPYAFNRKERKLHGEGGNIVGRALSGRVLIIDDVISAGTSVRESVELITAAGASLAGVAIALDRQERGLGELSAVQEVEQRFGVPVVSIANLDTLVRYLEQQGGHDSELAAMRAYRARYGAG